MADPIVELEIAKQHLGQPPADDDALISSYIDAAREWIAAQVGEMPVPVPASIKVAGLLLVGHWYRNRESVIITTGQATEAPMGVQLLIQQYRVMVA